VDIIEQAATLLQSGKLVAIPTETVYGLGADAKNSIAVQKIYDAKGRPNTNPLIIHIPNVGAMSDWAIDIPEDAYLLAAAFWPGPLTLILKRHPSVPLIVTAGQDTVAVRVPNHPLTLKLLKRLGSGIAAPSANRYGRISPTTPEHVLEELGNSVDFILDGGPCAVGIESTIVYLLGSKPLILREGSISGSNIQQVLGKEVIKSIEGLEIRSPGSSSSHYAPSKPLYLLEKEDLHDMLLKLIQARKTISVLSFSEKPIRPNPFVFEWITFPYDPGQYAQQLYQQLRVLDENDSECILVEMPPASEPWLGVKDRLQRASRPIK